MEEHRRKVLSMLSDGKISIDEAERLLSAMGIKNEPVEDGKNVTAFKPKAKPRFLRIIANESSGEKIDIKVPLGLLSAGVKLSSMMPGETRKQISTSLNQQGIDFDFENLNGDSLEGLIEQLGELEVNVGGAGETVRIFCE